MAIAEVPGFLEQGSGFRYEPIDPARGTSRCGAARRRRPRNVCVSFALVCAVLGILALSTSPTSREEEPAAADLLGGKPATLASSVDGAGKPRGETGRLQHLSSPSLATVERGPLQVRVANHYQLGENASTDLSMYPWQHVAEPYRETRIELTRVPHGVDDGANIM